MTWASRLLFAVLMALAVLSLGVALAPEPPAKPIPGLTWRVLHGEPQAMPLAVFSDLDTSIPNSIRSASGVELKRSWSPEGIRPLELEIGPIPPVAYLAVVYQGYVRDRDGQNALYLRCEASGDTRMISTGATHTALLEVVTPLGAQWCPKGHIYLRVKGDSPSDNLGAVQPYEVAAISHLKRSYVGLSAYFLLAFLVLLLIFFGGGLLAEICKARLDPVIAGLLALGSASLCAFYLYAWTPAPAPTGGVLVLIGAIGLFVLTRRWRAQAGVVWKAQRGSVAAWFLVAFTVFTLLHLGSTGSGTWEPNYRFAPASWSSDHTLPASFAEAARVGHLQVDGRLGDWSLSDRPPLMAGGYLLVADLFAALQSNNDGPYLQPIVLGVGGIALCGLWAAVFYWAARRSTDLDARAAGLAVFVVAVTPFAIFNTAYTWPKLLAAAFSLAAAALVLQPNRTPPRIGETCAFGALAAFALLSHASSAFFLAPVALIYLVTRLWRAPRAALAGGGLGLSLLAVWSGFKATVLPSSDPLMKLALTGDMGFSRPQASLPDLLAERYQGLTAEAWLRIKAETGAYLFNPHPNGQMLVPPPAPLVDRPDWVGSLRAWDFYSLSLGNLAILILGLAGVVLVARAWRTGPPRIRSAGYLLLASGGCYGLFLVATFLPLVVHQFSYDAILSLALAGVIGLSLRRYGRGVLMALAVATTAYVVPVWGVAPLQSLVTIDLTAAIALAAALVAAVVILLPAPPSRPRPSRPGVILGLLLTAFGGAAVALEPNLLLWQAPAPYAARRERPAEQAAPSACLGSFDGAGERRDGGWRAYGWAWDVQADAPAKSVRLVQPSGALAVEARMEQSRPDVAASFGDPARSAAGWAADLARPDQTLMAMAVLADGTNCRLDGRPRWAARRP